MGKIRCWEYMKCGQEKTMACPAYTQSAGRICWKVAGTMCEGCVQGTSAKKLGDCTKCDFYQKVKAGEI